MTPAKPNPPQPSLRILQIDGSGTVGCGDAMGPIPRDVFNLSVELANLGHQVTVADAPATSPRALPHPVRLVEFAKALPPALFSPTIRNYWRRQIALYWALRRAVSLAEFDVIHAHDWGSAWLLARTTPTPVVYTAHTPLWAMLEMDLPPRPKSLWKRLGRRLIVREIDAIRAVAATIALGRFLTAVVPDARMEVIPNGMRARWSSLPSRQEARAALGIAEDEFITLTVGRVVPSKGLEILLASVKALGPEISAAWIVGPYTERGSIYSYAQGLLNLAKGTNARFLGPLPNSSEEFRLRTAAADLFVLPSILENQGMAALEALQAGLPVIASAVGGVTDMVEGAGLLVPPGDAAALGEAILKLKQDPDLRARLASAGRERALHYDWADNARAHETLFREIVGRTEGHNSCG